MNIGVGGANVPLSAASDMSATKILSLCAFLGFIAMLTWYLSSRDCLEDKDIHRMESLLTAIVRDCPSEQACESELRNAGWKLGSSPWSGIDIALPTDFREELSGKDPVFVLVPGSEMTCSGDELTWVKAWVVFDKAGKNVGWRVHRATAPALESDVEGTAKRLFYKGMEVAEYREILKDLGFGQIYEHSGENRSLHASGHFEEGDPALEASEVVTSANVVAYSRRGWWWRTTIVVTLEADGRVLDFSVTGLNSP